MINNLILDNNYSNQSTVLWWANKALTPLAISTGHRTSIDGKTYHLAIRVLAGLAAVLIAPITLIALAVKWLKMPQKKADIPIPPAPMTIEQVVGRIHEEMEKIRELDVKLGEPVEGSWRAFTKANRGETNQTLDSYISLKHMALPDQQVLHVQRIGSFSKVDQKIIDITCDFLAVMHGIPVKLQEETLTMEQLKERYYEQTKENDQQRLDFEEKCKGHFPREADKMYESGTILKCMYNGLKPALKTEEDDNPRVISVTSEDIYHDTPKMDDFVFGVAYLGSRGAGVWSNARFGDPTKSPQDFEKCLLRTMKISAHEFSHMRNMTHCTDYECTVCGSMTMDEVDERPLLFCAQDTAKICYLTQTPILEHEQKLLDFFENFNRKYQLQWDCSKEIGTLKARIAKLSEK